MSSEAINAVGKYSKAKGSRKLLLVFIAHHSRPDGTGARPSLETLCAETGIEGGNLRRYLKDLRNLGELTWVSGRKNHANEYSILLFDEKYTGKHTQVNTPDVNKRGCIYPLNSENTRVDLPAQHVHAVNDVNVKTCMHDVADVSFGINAESAPDVQAAAHEALLSHGIDEPMASNLARQKPNECLRQVGYLPHRVGVREVPKFLVRAIQQSWKEPQSQVKSSTNGTAPKTESSTRSVTAPSQNSKSQSAPMQNAPMRQAPIVEMPKGMVDVSHDSKAEAIAREDEENAALDARLAAMPESQRAALRTLAEERMSYAPSFLRTQTAIASMIRTLMREETEEGLRA